MLGGARNSRDDQRGGEGRRDGGTDGSRDCRGEGRTPARGIRARRSRISPTRGCRRSPSGRPGLIPQQELDESHARDLVAEAQVASAKSRLRVEENKTRVAQAEEARLRTLRNYVTIAAPFAGTVTKRYANAGSMIQAGTASQSQAMPLVRLSQMSTLRLSLPVPESLVPAIRVGEPVEVRVKSLGRAFEGRVARFAAKVDAATRTMITEVDVAQSDRHHLARNVCRGGASGRTKHAGVLTVPLDALERCGRFDARLRSWRGGMIRIVPVQLGLEDAHRVEIVSGLNEAGPGHYRAARGLNAGDRVTPKVLGRSSVTPCRNSRSGHRTSSLSPV